MGYVVNLTNDITETVTIVVPGATSQEDAISRANEARRAGRGQAQAVLQDDTQNSRDNAYLADPQEDISELSDTDIVDLMRDEFLAALEAANSAIIMKEYGNSKPIEDADTLAKGYLEIRFTPHLYAGRWELTDLGRSAYMLDPTPMGVEGKGFKVRITRHDDPSDTRMVLLELQIRQKIMYERTLAPSFIIESN